MDNLTPPAWTLGQSAEIAELWTKLLAAADGGDVRARDFLTTFGPWAEAQLKDRLRS